MKPCYLFINTVNKNRPSLAVFDGSGHILCSYTFVDRQENLVEKFGDFLKRAKMAPAEIKAILVISGPGSFSASRAGIVLANSFNFMNGTRVLSVRDTGDSTEELIKNNLSGLMRGAKIAGKAYYQKEPDISQGAGHLQNKNEYYNKKIQVV